MMLSRGEVGKGGFILKAFRRNRASTQVVAVLSKTRQGKREAGAKCHSHCLSRDVLLVFWPLAMCAPGETLEEDLERRNKVNYFRGKKLSRFLLNGVDVCKLM